LPPNETTGIGTVTVTFDPTTRRLTWDGAYSGLTGPATGAYFQGPAEPGRNAGVVVTITPPTNPLKGSVTLTDTQAVNLMLGHWYVNIYTDANKGGELRGQLVRMQVRN
jgi:CHRD domain